MAFADYPFLLLFLPLALALYALAGVASRARTLAVMAARARTLAGVASGTSVLTVMAGLVPAIRASTGEAPAEATRLAMTTEHRAAPARTAGAIAPDILPKLSLIAVSLLFYAVGAAAFLPLLLLSVGGNYIVLHLMHRSAAAEKWLAAGVTLNLAVLAWFKYPSASTITPLGLSFFTFSQIGCLLHAAGDKPPRLRDYALFAAFFPALTAGPILNAKDTLAQISRIGGWRLTGENLAIGGGFFIIGLLKKTLLADPLAAIVDPGFHDPAGLTLLPAWQAACAYSLQLYFDFSGYSDMAIGLARMFGLSFPDNFDRPYRAACVIDYWQRWHMSLTRFLMTNVHAPLTMAIMRRRRVHGLPIGAAAQRSIGGFASMIALPIAVTMLLVSLWHGASCTYLAFGLLHAVFLLVNHAWRLLRGPSLPRVIGVAVTYLSVLSASVLFRATDLDAAGTLFAGMAGSRGMSLAAADPKTLADIAWLAALYAIVWAAPSTRQIMQGSAPIGLSWQPSRRWAVAMGCAATAGLLAAGGTGEFIYFRF